MNDKNLQTESAIASRFQNSEEAAEAGKIGGVKSGESRRRKRKFKDDTEMFLDAISARKDIPMTNQAAIIAAIGAKALRGDVKAAEFIRDTVGEKPAMPIDMEVVNGPITLDNVSSLSPEEIRRRRDELLAKAQESEG